MIDGILRLVTFRPGAPGAVIDAQLRDALAALASVPGLLHCYVARRGGEADAIRVIASVWSDRDALEAAVGSGGLIAAEGSPDDHDRTFEVLPLRLAVEADGGGELSVLRVFHGSVHPGQLDAYVAEAAAGVEADIAAGHGPDGFFLGSADEERFTTVSAWTRWESIEQATGGHVRNPFATRYSARLVEWTVDHYELIRAPVGLASSRLRAG